MDDPLQKLEKSLEPAPGKRRNFDSPLCIYGTRPCRGISLFALLRTAAGITRVTKSPGNHWSAYLPVSCAARKTISITWSHPVKSGELTSNYTH